ncbi:MAG: cation diffusion facilitator family transporter [Candidatus Scatovivens sp.]
MENSKQLQEDFEKTATKVSMISIIGNSLLSIFKILTGIFSHSTAMISDGIHSASDAFSSIIVIIGVKISSKASDINHPYGHERFECVAAIILSIILLITGLFIGVDSIKIIFSNNYQDLTIPGLLSLIAAIISIISKEMMYWYTKYYAKLYDSGALMADAWHHRSDSLSSVGALIGIAGARMGFPILDSIASLIICIFITKASYDIFKDAIDKMVDTSCDKETENLIREYSLKQNGVLSVDLLNTRIFGNKIYVDMEISADKDISLFEGHQIAEKVHNTIEENFTKVKHIMIHVNPK